MHFCASHLSSIMQLLRTPSRAFHTYLTNIDFDLQQAHFILCVPVAADWTNKIMIVPLQNVQIIYPSINGHI